MRKLFYVAIILMIASSCTKNDNMSMHEERTETGNTNVSGLQDKVLVMHVNAPNGLPVRSSPSASGERIGLLEDLSPVEVIREETEIVTLDGISGKWTFIKSGTIEGWVFGGYLSMLSPQMIMHNRPAISTEPVEGTIGYIGEYIFNDLNISRRRDVVSIEKYIEAMGLRQNYRLIDEGSWETMLHGGGIRQSYTIESGAYKIYLFANLSEGIFIVSQFVIELNNSDYLHLFPFRTMDEYLTNVTFGPIAETGSDFIRYFYETDYNTWILNFRNGILHSLTYAAYFS